jgi:cobalt-zinc-cadmium resistance protein CzcA
MSSVLSFLFYRNSLAAGNLGRRGHRDIKDKFRPLLMGGLVTSLGLLPASLAHGVGSQVQSPLAIMVVNGTLIRTIMMLLFLLMLLKFVQIEE